jgi:hypothetical protein
VLLRPEPGPSTLKITRWGGRRLAALRGAGADATVGESWEFSTLDGHESRALGRPLSAVLGAPLPFLAKLLDTASPLSVQVHPDDTADAPGKEEAWVVLAADPDAHVWAGVRPGVTRKQFSDALTDGARCLDLLLCHRVTPGAVLLVPARTIHAIGGGILLAEIQQPTDCTLRLHDHGSDRPIQPAEALAAADLAQQSPPSGDPSNLAPHRAPRSPRRPRDPRPRSPTDRDASVPTLLVPACGPVRVGAGADDERLEPGQLRLAIGPLRIDVPADALCILGTVT